MSDTGVLSLSFLVRVFCSSPRFSHSGRLLLTLADAAALLASLGEEDEGGNSNDNNTTATRRHHPSAAVTGVVRGDRTGDAEQTDHRHLLSSNPRSRHGADDVDDDGDDGDGGDADWRAEAKDAARKKKEQQQKAKDNVGTVKPWLEDTRFFRVRVRVCMRLCR